MSEVKAEVKDKVFKLHDGKTIVEAPLAKVAGALAIDALVNIASAVIVWEVIYKRTFGLSEEAWGMAAVVWLLIPWIYGLFCFSGNTIGTLIAGTRIVKIKNGDAPGPLRAAWFMFFRTVIIVGAPLWAILFLIALLSGDMDAWYLGGGVGDVNQYHLSIDRKATRELHDSTSGLM